MSGVFAVIGQAGNAASGGAYTLGVTYQANERPVLVVAFRHASATVTVGDGGTHTYTQIGSYVRAVSDHTIAFFNIEGTVTPGSYTVTITPSVSATFRFVGYLRGTGLNTTAAQDGQGQSQDGAGTGTDAISSTNMTPSSQPNTVLGVTLSHTNTVAITAGTGYTDLSNLSTYDGLNSDTSRVEYKNTTSTSAVAATFTHASSDDMLTFGAVFGDLVPGTVEQEGFRWGVDDANEASHTWEAAQDTSITIAANQSRLLRVLANATLDPTALAYTLRSQKNGAGGYVAVPIGASTDINPVIEAADATQSGNNTASSSWTTVAFPNASTGDLLVVGIAWDDSTATTGVTPPSGPNGETFTEINATPATDTGTTVRCKCWYTKATGSWTAGNLTFTPSASEQWTAAVIRVPEGEFDNSTPIGASATSNSGGSTTDNSTASAAITAGSTDGGGTLLHFHVVDVDPCTATPTGWTQIANTDRGAVSAGFWIRNTATSDSESISAVTTGWTIASSSWASVGFIVRGITVSNECYITTSGNITAGGEATTARLTAPSGKATSDFVTGRRWDDENGTDTIDITTDDYTEVEWLVALSSAPANADYFDFRVYAGSSPLDTYTLTPRWTVGSGGAAAASTFMLMGVGT